jgi:hypothetical protein
MARSCFVLGVAQVSGACMSFLRGHGLDPARCLHSKAMTEAVVRGVPLYEWLFGADRLVVSALR